MHLLGLQAFYDDQEVWKDLEDLQPARGVFCRSNSGQNLYLTSKLLHSRDQHFVFRLLSQLPVQLLPHLYIELAHGRRSRTTRIQTPV